MTRARHRGPLAVCSMTMASSITVTALLVTVAVHEATAQIADANTRVVDSAAATRAFVDAFNARALDKMLQLTTEDIEWLNINGPQVSIETSGKNALRKSMEAYFKQCASCRSSIDIVATTATRVVAIETAVWQSSGGERSQRSISVYEYQNGLIRRVHYFPVER